MCITQDTVGLGVHDVGRGGFGCPVALSGVDVHLDVVFGQRNEEENSD